MTTPTPAAVYGCFDRAPFVESHIAQNGTSTNKIDFGRPIFTRVTVRGAPACQYTLSALGMADKRCISCTHRGPRE